MRGHSWVDFALAGKVADLKASLPMYDLPELRRTTDSWWGGLGAHLRRAGVRGVPDHLCRPGEGLDFWLAPDLLISQSCGFPFVTRLAGRVTLLGTACYDVDGCVGSDYRSFVIVANDCPAHSITDLRGGRCAINLTDSWSGHHAMRLIAAPLIEDGQPAFEILSSGSHAASIEAVASGAADFAAIDCVYFGLLSRHRPQAIESLRIMGRTPPMPGLPLIAGAAVSSDDMRRLKEGLRAAFDDSALHDVRAHLGMVDIRFTSPADYRCYSAVLKQLDDRRIPRLL